MARKLHKTAFLNQLNVPGRKKLILWGSWFFFCVGLIQILIGLRYLSTFSFPQDIIGRVYTISAYTSHFILLSFSAWMLTILPITVIIPKRKIIVPLSVIVSSVILAATLLDSHVFSENRFHFNMLIMTILGWKTWSFGIVYFIIFIGFTSILSQKIFNFIEKENRFISGSIVSGLSIIFLLLAHGLHIWGDANYYTPITSFTTYMPLYYPATAKKFMMKHGLADLEQNRDGQSINDMNTKEKTSLIYPVHPLTFDAAGIKQNILFIVVDAMREDAFTEKLSPHIYSFSKDKIIFKNHYSGGNSSRMGAFSLLYGLPSTYWKYIESIGKSSVLIDKFQETNYEFGIFSSAPLYRPTSLDRTAFSNIKHLRLETVAANNKSYARDQLITEDWMKWLDERNQEKPFFGFLFYDAPTSKSYPSEYENYFETQHEEELSKIEKQYLKYKRAVYFTDTLVGKVLKNLEQKDLLKNTIVIITADHGEEFDDNELGFSGHGTAYSKYQLKIPLIISWPGKDAGEIVKRTSHNDIPATLMEEILGCRNPSSDYCSGQNIFSRPSWGYLIVGSYYNFAILEPEQITINYPGGYFEVRDKDYNIISNKNLNRKVLKAAIKETGRFYKNY